MRSILNLTKRMINLTDNKIWFVNQISYNNNYNNNNDNKIIIIIMQQQINKIIMVVYQNKAY